MAKEKKPKCIGSYSFRSVTMDGTLAKTYCDVYSNGITIANQLMLSKQDELSGFTKIYSKLGYNLFIKAFGLKLGSLMLINKATIDILRKNGVKEDDIV